MTKWNMKIDVNKIALGVKIHCKPDIIIGHNQGSSYMKKKYQV